MEIGDRRMIAALFAALVSAIAEALYLVYQYRVLFKVELVGFCEPAKKT